VSGERRRRVDVRRWVPVVVPALVGVAFRLTGHPWRANALWALAAVCFVLVLCGVPVERYVARLGLAVAKGVSHVASLLIGALLVVVGGVLRLVGIDPLTPRALRGNGWKPATAAAVSDRLASTTFGLESHKASAAPPRGGLAGFARGTTFVLGSLTVLLLLDLGIGLGWEKLSNAETPVSGVVDAINFTGNWETHDDPRADLPAMAAYPWAREYFHEIQRTPYSYWPFTESRPKRFKGDFVTMEDWWRRSYESPKAGARAPVVWMFGGSTTWGEGQRDEHTIASYLARIAEREGIPIKIFNYGQRGWTHFQEMVLFEQLLARGPVPDIAVFYDGANEINAQTLGAKGVPTHTLTDFYARRLTGDGVAQFEDNRVAPPSAAALAWEAYSGHSAIQKLVRHISDWLGKPAGASEAAAQSDDNDGVVTNYHKTIDDAVRAVDVYERGRAMTLDLAERYDVTPVFFWQPVMAGPAEVWADGHMSKPTINISDALDDHPEVYIDGGHTNEEGARYVAERIWREMRLQIERAARRRGTSPARPSGPASTSTTTTTVLPSDSERIAEASAALDAVVRRRCELGTWASTLGTLRADGPAEIEALRVLVTRFLEAAVSAAPPDQARRIAVIREFIRHLPTFMASPPADPGRPYLPQMAALLDLSAGWMEAIQGVILSLSERC